MSEFGEKFNDKTMSKTLLPEKPVSRIRDRLNLSRGHRWLCLALVCIGVFSFAYWQNQKKSFATWREEVRLGTGETIVIVQKRRFEFAYAGGVLGASAIVREAWLSINHLPTSSQIIVWHENLLPMSLDVVEGKLYVLGYPPTYREFVLYNNPRPAYLLHVWEAGSWRRLPLEKLPPSLKNANLLIDRRPPPELEYVDLVTKNSGEFNGDRFAHIAKPYKTFSPDMGKGW